ncbi:MAG: exodeoxyribonuclease III [Bdellovibrionales bacterium RIFOXYC1_FULL_54_43]|nr:MAG: exodeoxyribonuclease III [Bdellovibrionales bacterium RIFOXYC1_FULL_54_43]OFZ81595.1 MAG: exodeoxyribonuclease III [Bdellovibrionales bacterium RIFOXYD1_FULL_55_31]
MKLLSWNVNGIRAAQRGGFLDWFADQNADIVCVQEIKAFPEQLDEDLRNPMGYHSYWHPATKAGYSGLALFSRHEPLEVLIDTGHPEIDSEGRILLAEYPDFTVVNTYFPNSQHDHARLPYKLSFCEKFLNLANELRDRGKPLIICGDFNIAHKEIDLKNPKANENNAGFLPEERAWMDRFLQNGYVDGFRYFTPDPGHYTWWSYRPGVRAKNIGWRLDYFTINADSADRLKRVEHQPTVKGSDHCPVLLELKN